MGFGGSELAKVTSLFLLPALLPFLLRIRERDECFGQWRASTAHRRRAGV